MDASKIEVGKVYTDADGIERYVVSMEIAAGRRLARVHWRRPGRFATKIEEQTLPAFAKEVRKESAIQVERASALPNGGFALVWCVESKDGWCAVADGRCPEEGSVSVQTACGQFVTLPFGFDLHEPDCENCRAALAAAAGAQ